MSKIPSRWTDERVNRLTHLWHTEAPLRIIAAEMGVSIPTVSIKAKALKLPSRRYRAGVFHRETNRLRLKSWPLEEACQEFFNNMSLDHRTYLEASASKRDTTQVMILMTVLAIVINERMIDAVIDDKEEHP